MNQKKAKAIRRYVRSIGVVLAELPRKRSDAIGHTNPVTGQRVVYDLPLTARYPATSFQAAYTVAKRALRTVGVGIINARANLNLAAQA